MDNSEHRNSELRTDPDQLQADVRDLRRLGYAQELFRTMGGFSNFAISFSIISILTGAVTLYDYGLAMGGPAEMSLGWPIVALFSVAVAASMGEIASAFPTSGGMYHWAVILGGPGWGWFTAWFNILGLLATIAGIDYGCAQFLMPLLGLPSRPAVLLAVYGLVLASHGLINHYGIRLVARLNDASVMVHIVGVAAIIGALVIFAPKQPLSFFFRAASSNHMHFYGWAFLLGLLQAQWTFTGYDGSCHLSEETIDPRRRVPWGMINAIVISAVAGYLLLGALTLSIKSIPSVLSVTDAAGNKVPAVIAILEQSLGRSAGGAVSLLAVLAMWFCGLATVTSNSRTVYAFARDGGLPLARFWKHVSATHRTPAAAIWISVIAAFAVAIYGGAYSVVTSISTIGLYVSYVLPVYLGWRARRAGRWQDRGPWHLGRFSSVVNLAALGWTIFICVILVMPPNQRAAGTMLAVTAGLVIWFLASERRRFEAASAHSRVALRM
ncbi:MAG TPA: amino acid permease [Terriglobia bacterium]|nr:amino acid permease [Terriglobia bacterium]